MNLMYIVTSNIEFSTKNKKLITRIENIKKKFEASKVKVSDNVIRLGDGLYYDNALPYISKDRDVLKKPHDICKIRVNWKKKTFKNMSTEEIINSLKEQYAWNVTVVDAEHTRNKYKNKNEIWVVFDTEEKAKKAMDIFNSLFITAIELDCIEEYKRFKENPEKRPLTFDKLVPNYAELYDAVDNHEI